MIYRDSYIKYINSEIMEPSYFASLLEYTDYCNITCILSYNFLDMELTKKICSKRWNQYLMDLQFVSYE